MTAALPVSGKTYCVGVTILLLALLFIARECACASNEADTASTLSSPENDGDRHFIHVQQPPSGEASLLGTIDIPHTLSLKTSGLLGIPGLIALRARTSYSLRTPYQETLSWLAPDPRTGLFTPTPKIRSISLQGKFEDFLDYEIDGKNYLVLSQTVQSSRPAERPNPNHGGRHGAHELAQERGPSTTTPRGELVLASLQAGPDGVSSVKNDQVQLAKSLGLCSCLFNPPNHCSLVVEGSNAVLYCIRNNTLQKIQTIPMKQPSLVNSVPLGSSEVLLFSADKGNCGTGVDGVTILRSNRDRSTFHTVMCLAVPRLTSMTTAVVKGQSYLAVASHEGFNHHEARQAYVQIFRLTTDSVQSICKFRVPQHPLLVRFGTVEGLPVLHVLTKTPDANVLVYSYLGGRQGRKSDAQPESDASEKHIGNLGSTSGIANCVDFVVGFSTPNATLLRPVSFTGPDGRTQDLLLATTNERTFIYRLKLSRGRAQGSQ